MTCDEAHTMIHPYLDGELDLARALELERHLEGCPACSSELAGYRALQASMQTGTLYFAPPRNLEKRIRRSVREAGGYRAGFTPGRVWLFTVAASFVVLFLLAWKLLPIFFSGPSRDTLAEELRDSHIRSLMLNHLTDVVSSDQHTVKPWFNGKVDFSPQVKDLSVQGFPLVGGRLDYVGGKAVAVMVYQRRKHVINLFTWPSGGERDSSPSELSRQGYHMLGWQTGGMMYWAVSDLGNSELNEFVRLLRETP